MKILIALIIVLTTQNIEASILDDVKKYWVSFYTQLLGDPQPKIKLPEIPVTGKQNRKSLDDELKTKNKITFNKDDKERYDYSFIKELYLSVKQKEITDNEVSKWMNVLSQSGSREGIYRALVLDQSYLGLENYDYTASEPAVDFSLSYMNKYLAQNYEKEKLLNLNFYTLKRNIVEKTLEILDLLFIKMGDDIYDWYAVFSADMAREYPSLWKHETRKNIDPTKHQEWAKSVPDQYIKSEVIIKLHSILNQLQKSSL